MLRVTPICSRESHRDGGFLPSGRLPEAERFDTAGLFSWPRPPGRQREIERPAIHAEDIYSSRVPVSRFACNRFDF
jgi:hypothetical protein